MFNVATSQNFLTPIPMQNMSRHVEKAQKVKKFRATTCFFLLCMMQSSCPKEFKNAIKLIIPNFSQGHHLVCLTYKEWSKIDIPTNYMSLVFYSSLVCHWHVNMSMITLSRGYSVLDLKRFEYFWIIASHVWFKSINLKLLLVMLPTDWLCFD